MSVYFTAIFKTNEGDFIAHALDFPGCIATGFTLEDVCENIAIEVKQEAIRYRKRNHDLPVPSSFDESVNKTTYLIDEFRFCYDGDCEPFLQMVQVPDPSKFKMRIQVSLSGFELDVIDTKAKKAGKTRSKYLVDLAMNDDTDHTKGV